ncbi:hypothetical protein KR222_009278 [Zaprionus bogoriensis]|nr:hypothetical protein KR222_009278 [Zaprionus bogoriensis]
MSWQDYVDNQLLASQCVTKACIAGHDGNIWAQSKEFETPTPTHAKRSTSSTFLYARHVAAFTLCLHFGFACSLLSVTKEELAKLISGFDQQDLLTSNGVTLAGQRYIYLSGTDRVVRAKLGRSGVHCMKTTQAVIVSIYEDPVQPQQAASVVEKLGDYLITCGY